MRFNYMHRIVLLFLFLLFLVLFGTFGYMLLLDIGFLDGLYMTIIAISTVGYTEVAQMTPNAQLFSIFIIVTSVGTVGFVVSKLGSFFKEGYFTDNWRKNKMEKTIAHMDKHYIICGIGETGMHILTQFRNRKVPFIVIDKDENIIEELKEKDINYVHGDATSEEVLNHARIDKAKGLVATLSKDADNVFVVLTARQLNADLHIVARAIDHTAHKKLKRAGANYTVSPNEIGGRKIAAMMLKPSTTYFMDNVIQSDDITLDLEEIEIQRHSEICNKPLKDAKIASRTGLIVLAIRKQHAEEFRFNPGADEFLQPHDKIIVIGKHEQIEVLRKMAKD